MLQSMQENEKDSATRALGESPVNLAALAALDEIRKLGGINIPPRS